MDIREQIVAEARSYIGTPFHHQGRLKGVGIDCVGLVVNVGKSLGLIDHDNTEYSRYPDGKTLMEQINSYGVQINNIDMQAGDVVVLWIVNPRIPTHLGIVTDYGFIHTYADIGRVVEHRFTEAWKRRIVGVYKYPGVE